VPSSDLPIAHLKAELFKALGNPVRVRILEELVAGERSVGALADAVGSEIAGVSQQLAVLRKAQVVVSRREATTVFYSLRDPDMVDLLAVARRMLIAGLQDSQNLLSRLEADTPAAQR
jgi:DNA-binding transcriptional ArsR family regulator